MIKKAFLTLFLSLTGIAVSAQQYQTTHLKKAAEKLSLNPQSLKPGISYLVVNNHRLVVRINEKGTVEHIGIPLFNQLMRALQPSPIYDYLENAVLNKVFAITDNTLNERQVQFHKGSWQILEQLGDSLAATITNLDDKTYVVSWSQDGQEVAQVNFPISYDLLASSSRGEMEENFVRDLRAFKTESFKPLDISSLPLMNVVDSVAAGIYPTDGQSYVIPSITNRLYVQVDKDGSRHLLIDKRHVAESLANMLLSPAKTEGSLPMELSVRKSDYHTVVVNTTPKALHDYCLSQGCKPFFGFESIRGGNASATLIMSNKASGYDHIIHITCSTSDIGSEDLVLRATAYLFTPTHNVKTLFGGSEEMKNSKSLILWK